MQYFYHRYTPDPDKPENSKCAKQKDDPDTIRTVPVYVNACINITKIHAFVNITVKLSNNSIDFHAFEPYSCDVYVVLMM